MGYSYTNDGKLCCDVCSKSGGVRKYHCPFGYCPAVALCPDCKAKHPEYLTAEFHRHNGCEKSSLEFKQQKQEKADLIAAGRFVRCSALWLSPEDKVKVIFHSKTQDKAYFMTQATYDAIPLMTNATVEDYQLKGEVTECRNLDIYDAEDTPVTEPAPVTPVITKEIILAKPTFNGMEICGRRGRKAPSNQTRLELGV